MIRILTLLFAISTWSQISGASQFPDASAHRDLGHSYLEYKQLYRPSRVLPNESVPATPLSTAHKQIRLTDLPAATPWESEAVMTERFKRFRDERFLTADSRPNFLRRSTWLYPDDGCFARAALAIRNLSHWSAPLPKKVFAFGDLLVNTPNAIDGQVGWWYHVAPLVEVHGQKYVLDPSLEPHRPLKLQEWLALMSSDPGSLEVTVCESGTYTPGDDCNRVSDGEEEYALQDQKNFLDQEWQRLLDLHRNPERELGEYPPWLH